MKKVIKNSRSVETVIESFIAFKRDNEDLEEFVLRDRQPHLKQPFILAILESGREGIEPTEELQFYIVIDTYSVFCGTDILNTFKILFSAFYAFDLRWPSYLSSFYKFFEEVIFRTDSFSTVSPSVGSFVAKLDAVQLTSIEATIATNTSSSSDDDC